MEDEKEDDDKFFTAESYQRDIRSKSSQRISSNDEKINEAQLEVS